MAHGLESRVPLLDHPLVELAATIPSNIKFADGTMKHILKKVMEPLLPKSIIGRQDKMGFPTPLTDWIKGEARDFVYDLFSSQKALSRDLVDNQRVLEGISKESKFGRKIWGLLCLELWRQTFHDRESGFRGLLEKEQCQKTRGTICRASKHRQTLKGYHRERLPDDGPHP